MKRYQKNLTSHCDNDDKAAVDNDSADAYDDGDEVDEDDNSDDVD